MSIHITKNDFGEAVIRSVKFTDDQLPGLAKAIDDFLVKNAQRNYKWSDVKDDETILVHRIDDVEFVKGEMTEQGKIEKFCLSPDYQMYALLIGIQAAIPIEGLQKIKNKPLFKTEDGVDIFETDVYWFVTKNNQICRNEAYAQNAAGRNNNNRYFSSEQAAKDWITRSKKILLFKAQDGINIYTGDRFWIVDNENKIVEDKIDIYDCHYFNCHPVFKYFSSEQAARHWIIQNRPLLSIAELMQAAAAQPGQPPMSLLDRYKLAASKKLQ